MSNALTDSQPAQAEIVRYGDETADIHSSSDEYAARFSGPVGAWMLAVQERAVLAALDHECTTVLDVGGGHGQIAVPLSKANRSVTVLGSAHICAERLRDFIESGAIAFRAGNLIELPFPDQSFNVVASFRLMSHCTVWRALVKEMCRASNHAVIVDYPVWFSFNFLTPLLFRIKHMIEGNTRTYRIFSSWEVRREFKRNGYRLESVTYQFFFPMGLHRALKSPTLSRRLESIARGLGLTWLFGSPAVAKFVRVEGKPRG